MAARQVLQEVDRLADLLHGLGLVDHLLHELLEDVLSDTLLKLRRHHRRDLRAGHGEVAEVPHL